SFKIENFSFFGWDGTITMLPLIIIGFAVNVGVILMLFLMSYSHKFHNFIMHYGIGFLAKIKIIKKPDKTRENLRIQVENFKIELRRLQANIPVTILIVFLFLCILAIRFSIPYFSGLALNAYGANEGFRFDRLNDACFRSAFHQMVSGLVPLPGGAGISEIVYNSMFNGFFVETYAVTETGLSVIRTPSANVMSTQILWRIATFYFVLIASGIVAALYHSRGQGEQLPYASRQTFVDLQLQTYDQRKLSSETLYETRQLSRKAIKKTMVTNSLNDYGLVTGDDYIGPYEPYKGSSKKSNKKTVIPPDED
ncbi:MAG: flippase-like domain-containing protein, partial [Bacilli bacterium]|nr:flippase-like domain-containing protein [Bacilli bacterium]